MRAGCHLSRADGFEKMAQTAVKIGAETFQFFSGNPRGGRSRPWQREDVDAMMSICRENGIGQMVCHAPYILNPASDDPEKRQYAREAMQSDLDRLRQMPGVFYNFHPGCHRGQGNETGMEQVAELLRSLNPGEDTVVLLETMAGKVSELGAAFEELGRILDLAGRPEMGVCLDTCHVWDAGYDIVHSLDRVLEDFDRAVGLSRLRVIHMNDSMSSLGSHRDRHARIGEGMIGREALRRVCDHPLLRDRPMILETPSTLEGYAEEIRWMKGKADECILGL